MYCNKKKHFLLNYGWDHVWCDPEDNLSIKEVIKGLFAKSKIVCSIPYVTRCQQEGTSINFREGIPDCWEEYLVLRFFETSCQNYELMHKKDADAVPYLRKYRLYIGQGIPDPWALNSYIDNPEDFSHLKATEKFPPHRARSRSAKERCFCCQKEYLFGCPDKYSSDAHFCSCKDCHGKGTLSTESSEKCICNEIFQHWLFEHTDLNKKKELNSKENSSPSLSNFSNSETEDESGKKIKKKNKYVVLCQCLQNHKGHECFPNEKSGLESGDCKANEKSLKFNNKNCKEHSKIYFCPYIKNFYLKKKLGNESDKEGCLEPKISVSKEIQTEINLKKSSKTVQTEKSEQKSQLKCTCQSKCFCYSTYHCNTPCVKAGCLAAHSMPSFCCPSNCTQTPTYIYPYSFGSHCTIHKCCNTTTEKHRKKKHHKESKSEDGSNAANECNKKSSTNKNSPLPKSKTNRSLQKRDPAETYSDNIRCNKSTCYHRTPLKIFDHSKYLADYKLKGFLEEEDIFSAKSDNKNVQEKTYSNLKFKNFCKEPSFLGRLGEEGVSLERFKSFPNYNPKNPELPFTENKMSLQQKNLYHSNIHKIIYCDQAITTATKKPERWENNFKNKLTASDQKTETNKFKICSINDNQEFTKNLKKHRQLLRHRNRKRKRNLGTNGKAFKLKYQDFLRKQKESVNCTKGVQIEENSLNCLQSHRDIVT